MFVVVIKRFFFFNFCALECYQMEQSLITQQLPTKRQLRDDFTRRNKSYYEPAIKDRHIGGHFPKTVCPQTKNQICLYSGKSCINMKVSYIIYTQLGNMPINTWSAQKWRKISGPGRRFQYYNEKSLRRSLEGLRSRLKLALGSFSQINSYCYKTSWACSLKNSFGTHQCQGWHSLERKFNQVSAFLLLLANYRI